MPHTAVLVAVIALSVPVSAACPQGGDADRARADALKALKGNGDGRPFSQDFERSKQKWPAYDREIEAGIIEQQKALDAGAKAAEDLLLMLHNRAKMQETPPALYLHGRLLGLLDRVDHASQQFEVALRLDPYFPWAHHGAGTCAAKRGKFPEAIRAYRRALELNPMFVRSMEPLAACLLHENQGDEAERWLRRLLDVQPESPDGWKSLGKLLAQRARYPEAVSAFRTALGKKPGDAEARRALALTLGLAGQSKDAQVIYQDMLKDEPTNANALLGLARTYDDLGENHVAADHYQKALDHWTSSLTVTRQDLVAKIEELRRLPPVEKRDPKRKTPHEWCEILVNSTEPDRCREAIRVLSTCPDFESEVYKTFLRALQNKDGPTRVLAVKELFKRYEGILHDLTPLMILMLEDKERLVRAMVANRLGKSDDNAAVPALVKALKERDPYVFREVYDALWRLTTSDMSVLLPSELTPEVMAERAKGWERWYADNRDLYKKYEAAPK
jgi:tetratricopeptide (TPR) repeat protein